VIAVADSSPFVILAKLGCFDLLNSIFSQANANNDLAVYFSGDISEVAKAKWIVATELKNPQNLLEATHEN
jgi:hypothetical protein